MGCGINLDKSEVVVVVKTALASTELFESNFFKSEFVWLGYSLTISNDHRLVFTNAKVNSKIAYARKLMRNVFQYTNSTFLKWKTYKCYVAPYIELYLPNVAKFSIYSRTELHRFQHEALCRIARVPRSTSYAEVLEAFHEWSVGEKTTFMADRMLTNAGEGTLEEDEATLVQKTISGKLVSTQESQEASERRDFIRRLKVYRRTFPDSIRKLRKRGGDDESCTMRYKLPWCPCIY